LRTLWIAVFVFLIMVPASAAEPDKQAPPKPSFELRSAFWRARSEFFAAQDALDKASAALNAAVQKLSAACADTETLAFDNAGEPSCSPKTPQPAPETKK